MSIEPNNILYIANEALEYANAAVYFDYHSHHGQAVEFYIHSVQLLAKCLNIINDETLEEYKNIYALKQRYEDRLIIVKQFKKESVEENILVPHLHNDLTVDINTTTELQIPSHNSNNDLNNLTAINNNLTSPSNTKSSNKKNFLRRLIKRNKPIKPTFQDYNNELSNVVKMKELFESPPTNIVLQPYWIMRCIRRTITSGGFLAPRVCIPKIIWSPNDLRFSGLSSKTFAYETVNSLIINNLIPLPISLNNNVLDRLKFSLNIIHEEIIHLQNHLSKPFPYIREITIPTLEELGSSPTSQVGKVANIMFNITKNVRKYAEVGYQRIGTIPTLVKSDDFSKYTLLISDLCDKCQIFELWVRFLSAERDELLKKIDSASTSMDASDDIVSAIPSTPVKSNQSEDDVLLYKIEGLLNDFNVVSIFMNDVVCEILLRDIEFLLERYLHKTRKAFTKMQWDDDEANASLFNNNNTNV